MDGQAGLVYKLRQSEQKLTAAPATLGPIIQINHKTLHIAKILLSLIPPKQEPIYHEITGFTTTGKKQK